MGKLAGGAVAVLDFIGLHCRFRKLLKLTTQLLMLVLQTQKHGEKQATALTDPVSNTCSVLHG